MLPARRGACRCVLAVLLSLLVSACGAASEGRPAGPSGAVPVPGSPATASTVPVSPPIASTGIPAGTSASPDPSTSPSAGPSASASSDPSKAVGGGAYRIDVWHSYALVTQADLLHCVPAAAAIMVDLVRGRRAADASVLPEMYAVGQSLAVYPNEGPGVDPAGWVGILDRWGAPGYAWHSYATLPEALHHAAIRLRETGRPVGLIVGIHRQHAWVLTGFATTADPRSRAFSVSGIAITGPLWPAQRYYLGYFDMPPDTWMTPAGMAPAVRPFHADVPTQWDGRYVTIEP